MRRGPSEKGKLRVKMKRVVGDLGKLEELGNAILFSAQVPGRSILGSVGEDLLEKLRYFDLIIFDQLLFETCALLEDFLLIFAEDLVRQLGLQGIVTFQHLRRSSPEPYKQADRRISTVDACSPLHFV